MQIFNSIGRFVRYLLSYLYHSECVFCLNETRIWDYVCEDCKNKIYEREHASRTPDGFLCMSAFEYNNEFKNSVLRFKFFGKRDYSKTYAKIIADKYSNKIKEFDADFVTNVPLSNKSYKKRGYDQAELLAKDIAFFFKKPYNKVLSKTQSNNVQHELSKEMRKINVKNVYSINDKSDIKGKRILLCDDIITTGWTLNECAQVLKTAGAADVLCVTAARTPPE